MKIYGGYNEGTELAEQVKEKVNKVYRDEMEFLKEISKEYISGLMGFGEIFYKYSINNTDPLKHLEYLMVLSNQNKEDKNPRYDGYLFSCLPDFAAEKSPDSINPLAKSLLIESMSENLGNDTAQFYNNLFLKNGHALETLATLLEYERDTALGDYSKMRTLANFSGNILDDYGNSKIASFSSDLVSLVDNLYHFIAKIKCCELPNSNGNKVALRDFLRRSQKNEDSWLADYLEKTFYEDPLARFVYNLANNGKHGKFNHKLQDLPFDSIVKENALAFSTRLGISFSKGDLEKKFYLIPFMRDLQSHFARGILDSVSETFGITKQNPLYNSSENEKNFVKFKKEISDLL